MFPRSLIQEWSARVLTSLRKCSIAMNTLPCGHVDMYGITMRVFGLHGRHVYIRNKRLTFQHWLMTIITTTPFENMVQVFLPSFCLPPAGVFVLENQKEAVEGTFGANKLLCFYALIVHFPLWNPHSSVSVSCEKGDHTLRLVLLLLLLSRHWWSMFSCAFSKDILKFRKIMTIANQIRNSFEVFHSIVVPVLYTTQMFRRSGDWYRPDTWQKKAPFKHITLAWLLVC